jgi:transcriptional regulator with XRE-family HTH domain
MSTESVVNRLKSALEEETLRRDEVRRLFAEATQESSQRALARALGISQSAIAQRLRGYESDYDTQPLETLKSLASDIRLVLESNTESLPTLLRIVAQGISDFRSLTQAHDQRFFLREPPSTKHRQWDALLAAVAAREARLAGIAIPRWTTKDHYFLDRAWFPTETPGIRAMAFAGSPADFAIRNIYLDPQELESI